MHYRKIHLTGCPVKVTTLCSLLFLVLFVFQKDLAQFFIRQLVKTGLKILLFYNRLIDLTRIQISVVIPTCERKARLLSLLRNLDVSTYPLEDVIIVDSGTDRLSPDEYAIFSSLNISYLTADRSVCIQRNLGINKAKSPWIFLCDDDMELPADYLQQLVNHLHKYPETGAVSGVWLQKENTEWKSSYPVRSSRELLWKFIFQLGIWGEIDVAGGNFLTRKIKDYYKKKGNHLSKAGWPVNVNFEGEYILCPIYSLGASLVRKQWLITSPYDEVLDPHGIGDNYGVAVDFPIPGIHVISNVFVRHHKEPSNRLKGSLQYYRRTLALDYFIKTKPALKNISRLWLAWSLAGNFLFFLFDGNYRMMRAALKSLLKMTLNRNPYYLASRENRKIIEPLL